MQANLFFYPSSFFPDGPISAWPDVTEDTAPAHRVNPAWRHFRGRPASEWLPGSITTRIPWLYDSGYIQESQLCRRCDRREMRVKLLEGELRGGINLQRFMEPNAPLREP